MGKKAVSWETTFSPLRIVHSRYKRVRAPGSPMGKVPILPDVFESWLEKQKVKPVHAKPGFLAEEKIKQGGEEVRVRPKEKE